MTFSNERAQLLAWIDAERDDLVSFLSGLVRTASPNPPGDTRAAAGVLEDRLTRRALPVRVGAPRHELPNVVASLEGAKPGRHLVLNGHLVVFPCDDADRWTQPPWGGDVVDGRLYGRGVSDMKNGT